MTKILKSKRAEGYIDIAVGILVIAFVLLLIMSIWSMVTLKQDMQYMCDELLEVACVTGRIGPEVEARYLELCAEAGFTPNVNYAAIYFDSSSGKVQLGDSITCMLSCQMTLPGFGGFELPFTVTVEKSGLSRMYWK